MTTAVLWIADAVYLARGVRSVDFLRDVAPLEAAEPPLVTVCIPARNEEQDVEEGVRSALDQDYPRLEVVAVDDRSTDGTGEILERLAREREDEDLRIVHVRELPEGWVGKNHALYRAAEAARGELLLFVDADVSMGRGAVRRAVGRLLRRELDQLTAAPRLVWPHGFLRALGALFSLSLAQYHAPWKPDRTGPRRAIGIGAFTLVRRSAYRRAGGHRAVARRPDDDMALARQLKASGARLHFLYGRHLLAVPWYRSVTDFVQGVSRASFATVDYSILRSAGTALGTALLCVWPWVAVAVTTGPTRWANLVAAGAMAALFLITRSRSGARAQDLVWWPLATLVLAYVALHSAGAILLQGGIVWRDTFYPLEMLRADTASTRESSSSRGTGPAQDR